MQYLSKTFFITGTGRSGTAFLAKLLDRSEQYRVVHEWRLIPRTRFRDGRIRRFPYYRFWLFRRPFEHLRKGYGEVNSHLRKVADPVEEGPERFIEKRAVILRDPRDVIASNMNRKGNMAEDFARVCETGIREHARVVQLLNHPTLHYDRFEFDRLTTDRDYLQSVVDWTGITDVEVRESDLKKKVNISPSTWFPRWEDWNEEQRATYLRLKQEWLGGSGTTLAWQSNGVEDIPETA